MTLNLPVAAVRGGRDKSLHAATSRLTWLPSRTNSNYIRLLALICVLALAGCGRPSPGENAGSGRTRRETEAAAWSYAFKQVATGIVNLGLPSEYGYFVTVRHMIVVAPSVRAHGVSP